MIVVLIMGLCVSKQQEQYDSKHNTDTSADVKRDDEDGRLDHDVCASTFVVLNDSGDGVDTYRVVPMTEVLFDLIINNH